MPSANISLAFSLRPSWLKAKARLPKRVPKGMLSSHSPSAARASAAAAKYFVALASVAALPAILGGGGGNGGFNLMIMAGSLPILYLVAHKFLPIVFRRAAVSQNQEAFALCSLGACLLVACSGGGNVANPQQTTAGGKICVIYT